LLCRCSTRKPLKAARRSYTIEIEAGQHTITAAALDELCAADPFVGAVGEALVLPDRHRGLQLVDQLMARVEGLCPVRTGHADDNRKVTYVEVSDGAA
jgi:hypothetical protein